MSYFKKHKEGILLTTLFHLAIILILLQLGFFTPLPLPEDKGVLVDFGNTSQGMGKIEPKIKPTPKQPQEEQKQEQVTPPPQPKTTPAVPETKPNEGKEEVVTQDYEKTVAVDEGKKKREEEERKKREEEARKKKAAEEQKRKEDLAKQQQLEKERLAREAREKRIADSLQQIEDARLAELRRIAEKRRQDSIKRAEEQAKIDAINNLTKNAFSGNSGAADNSSSSSGQGVTYQPGNQGTSTGTPGANTYGLGGGDGITFNLSGRSALSLPKPSYPGQEDGIVVVQVTVDKSGVVTKAEPGVKGSTSLDAGLLNAAKRAALSARFNENKNAPAYQTGTITYRFVLN